MVTRLDANLASSLGGKAPPALVFTIGSEPGEPQCPPVQAGTGDSMAPWFPWLSASNTK